MPISNIAKKRDKAKIKISSKREAAMQRIMDSYSEDPLFRGRGEINSQLYPLFLWEK